MCIHLQEFDPEEFYRFLEEAEGRARDMQKVGDGLPQYIFQKLGLHKDESPRNQIKLIFKHLTRFLYFLVVFQKPPTI